MNADTARNRDSAQTQPQTPGQAALQRDPADWVTGEEPMTEAQGAYLRTLCKEAGESFDENLTKAEASRLIDELRQRTGRGDAASARDADDARPSGRGDAARDSARAAAGRRSAQEVIEDHLRRWTGGDIEGDIENNHAEEVILLTAAGPHHGADGVRLLARILADDLPDAGFEIAPPVIEKDYAYVEWKARGAGGHIKDGVESFVIRGGKIAARTLHYTVVHSKSR
jgi:hypothetical protein